MQVHRVKAAVTLQGELYHVASAARIFSVRVTGNEGKAFQAALADMTKKVAAAGPPGA